MCNSSAKHSLNRKGRQIASFFDSFAQVSRLRSASCNTCEQFSPLASAIVTIHAGNETFLRTALVSVILRYSTVSTSTNARVAPGSSSTASGALGAGKGIHLPANKDIQTLHRGYYPSPQRAYVPWSRIQAGQAHKRHSHCLRLLTRWIQYRANAYGQPPSIIISGINLFFVHPTFFRMYLTSLSSKSWRLIWIRTSVMGLA